MANWDDVRAVVAGLPGTDEHASYGGAPSWRVAGKGFVWERPLRARDLVELGDAAPTGPVLGVRVADEGVRQALIADRPDVFFTVSHFDGYPAVLARLDRLDPDLLVEVVEDAWRTRATRTLLAAHDAASTP